jgi:DNA repair protein RecN (Recombination protein N)
MLRLLRIRNLAVVASVDVELDDGFTAITGETGAGKSMLVEAVTLLLGGRASADLVRTGESLASVEAVFEDTAGAELIVRREVTDQGRSRAFVNGALVTAAGLREHTAGLVELHGQHEHQTLLEPERHLALLDGYAGASGDAARVAAAWASLQALRERMDRAAMDGKERAARLDLIDFQLGEIDKVQPRDGEDDELIALRQVLSHAERVQRLCTESYAALYDGEHAVLAQLAAARKRIGELATIAPEFVEYAAAGDAIKSQLDDLALFVRDFGARVDASPERLQQVEDRLAALERLKRKHGPTLADVLAKWTELQRSRTLLTDAAERADDIRSALDEASRAFLDAARVLSRVRRDAARRFQRDIETVLGGFAMQGTRFEVRFEAVESSPDRWSAQGIDRAEFYVSPNPGEDLRPLARIASGGELSRMMLAIKTLVAHPPDRHPAGQTLIFDEVDAGIGGAVADVVGARLAELGRDFQVLCITHLAQIAARARTQYRVAKTVRGARTVTTVERLADHGRVEELARMMTGLTVTPAAKSSARELLELGQSGRRAKGESESRPPGESARTARNR